MGKREWKKLEKELVSIIDKYERYLAGVERKYKRELAKREAKIAQLQEKVKEQQRLLRNQQKQMQRRRGQYEKLVEAVKADRETQRKISLAKMRVTNDFGESAGMNTGAVKVQIISPILVDAILDGGDVNLKGSTKQSLRESASFQAGYWARAMQRGVPPEEARKNWEKVFGDYEDVGEIKAKDMDPRFKVTKFYT